MPGRESPYVSSVQPGKVIVASADREWRRKLSELGGKKVPWSRRVIFQFDGEHKLAELLGQLRNEGVAFAGAPAGWPPAAVFEDLRTKGLVHGPFVEVVWHGKNRIETGHR